MTTEKQHGTELIVGKLRDADAMLAAGKTMEQTCQYLGVSEPTLRRWQTRYGKVEVGEIDRIRRLEKENRRLKRLLADAELDKAILREALREGGL